MKRLLPFALLVLVAFVSITGCEDVVKDATFREWCGESLCQWKLEEGRIRKAATWHKGDHGVEFLDAPTTISQISISVPKCLEFDVIADVDPTAQVSIGLDFNNDGIIDDSQPIAAVKFRAVKTLVTAPTLYRGLRIVISKKGTGRAVLAQMNVKAGTTCTAPPVVLKDLALGSVCVPNGNGDECRSGVCCDGRCSECCLDRAQAETDAGFPMLAGAECANPEARCEVRAAQMSLSIVSLLQGGGVVPYQCDPGKGRHMSGEECMANDDCASGACVGATSLARRVDETVDGGFSDCEGSFPDAGADCFFASVRPGRCR